MTSPNRLLARLLIASMAMAGSLAVALLTLVDLGSAPTIGGAGTLWCMIAPLSSVDSAIHLAALAVCLLGLGVVLTVLRSISRERAIGGELRAAAQSARLQSPPPRMQLAADSVGVAERIDVVESQTPFGFVYGWTRPRICVSTGMIERLDERELEAVLHHEQWHVLRRDPIRLLIIRAIASAAPFIPAIRRAARQSALAIELAADRHAVTMMGQRRWLAAALEKVVNEPQFTRGTAFTGQAEARIAALAGEPLALDANSSRLVPLLLLSELGALAMLLAWGGASLLQGVWLHPMC